MKTIKLECSFNTFDKLNRASLAAPAKNDTSEMRNLAVQYRAYAKRANEEVKTLAKDFDEVISLALEYNGRALAAEKVLALTREMNVLRMQFDTLCSKFQALQLKKTELDPQVAPL